MTNVRKKIADYRKNFIQTLERLFCIGTSVRDRLADLEKEHPDKYIDAVEDEYNKGALTPLEVERLISDRLLRKDN